MRRVDELITVVRSQTDNVNYGDSEGISQNEFVELLNDAQTNIFLKILSEVPDTSIFDAEATVSLVADTRGYGDSSRWGIKNAVRFVEFSPTGQEQDYYFLDARSIKELTRYPASYPSTYSVQNGLVLVSPMPSSSQGSLRITYVKRPDTLDIRRARVDSTSTNYGGYATVVLDTDFDIDAFFETASGNSQYVPFYFSVCNDYGVSQFYAVECQLYDTSTKTMTINVATSQLTDGVISPTNWITLGKYSSTNSSLPEEFERYLIAYATVEILKRDSSKDAQDWRAKLKELEGNLIALAQDSTRDVCEIPISNDFYQV